jgi:hypothetical protein
MRPFRTAFLALSLLLVPGSPLLAQQEPPPAASESGRPAKPKPFEISYGNLYEALRQMAAYRKLDLVIDPDVPNRKGLYAFKHTTWEKALEILMSSHDLSYQLRDGILHVGLAARFPGDPARALAGGTPSRAITITYRPAGESEPLLTISVSRASRSEILEALAKVERIARNRPGLQPFNASWALRPVKEPAKEELETFSMEDVTPSGLRALYP